MSQKMIAFSLHAWSQEAHTEKKSVVKIGTIIHQIPSPSILPSFS